MSGIATANVPNVPAPHGLVQAKDGGSPRKVGDRISDVGYRRGSIPEPSSRPAGPRSPTARLACPRAGWTTLSHSPIPTDPPARRAPGVRLAAPPSSALVGCPRRPRCRRHSTEPANAVRPTQGRPGASPVEGGQTSTRAIRRSRAVRVRRSHHQPLVDVRAPDDLHFGLTAIRSVQPEGDIRVRLGHRRRLHPRVEMSRQRVRARPNAARSGQQQLGRRSVERANPEVDLFASASLARAFKTSKSRRAPCHRSASSSSTRSLRTSTAPEHWSVTPSRLRRPNRCRKASRLAHSVTITSKSRSAPASMHCVDNHNGRPPVLGQLGARGSPRRAADLGFDSVRDRTAASARVRDTPRPFPRGCGGCARRPVVQCGRG